MAASCGSDRVRQTAFNFLNDVARTGSQLQMFIDYIGTMRGWGRGLRRAVGEWYTHRPVKQAVYQTVEVPAAVQLDPPGPAQEGPPNPEVTGPPSTNKAKSATTLVPPSPLSTTLVTSELCSNIVIGNGTALHISQC